MRPSPYPSPTRTMPPASRPRRLLVVLCVVLGSVVLLMGTALFVIVAVKVHPGDFTDGPISRSLLVQETQPGPAYRYGTASIYNACSLVTLDDLRKQGLTPNLDQRLDEYYPVVDQPEKTFGQPFKGLSPASECGIFVQAHGHVKVEVLQ